MKKFLLLLALVVLGALWNGADARYNLGGRKAYNEIKNGDTIAIQGISDNANNGYRWITGTKLQTAFTSAAVFVVEEGPMDLRTGDPTHFLLNVDENKYFGHDGLRGKTPKSSLDFKLVSTPDSAYNFALYCCADSSVAWNGQKNFDEGSTVFCYSYDNDGEKDWGYICNWGWFDSEDIRIWGYQDTNPWDVYSVYSTTDYRGELQDLLDYYESLNLEFTPGSDPGYYPQDLADAYNQALEEATFAVQMEHTDAEYKEYYDNLKAAKEAVEKAYIEITDGYYYVVCAYTGFLNSQKVEKALYAESTNNYILWKTIDTKDPAFLFKFTKQASGNFNVQSYFTEKYWDASSSQSSSQGILYSAKPNHEQVFSSIGGGQWQIWNTYYGTHYHPESNSNGSGKNGKIVTWNSSGKGSTSTWYLRRMDDMAFIDSLDAVKAQTKLTEELQALCATAGNTYDKLFVYAVDTEKPLITNVSDDDPQDCQLSSNASDPSEGLYLSYLIDGDAETFWHSTYHPSNDPGTYHYIQADISNTPTKSFQIYFMRRSGSYGNYDRPTAVNIYATADTTGQSEGKANWKLVKALAGLPTSSSVNEYYSPGIELDAPASYIRFEVIEKSNYPSRALNGYPYFNLAEFQIYPVTLSETTSQYYYIDGMKDAADNLNAKLEEARAKVADNTATREDIDALQAAINGVDSLYADTTSLKNLITACEAYVANAVVGEEIGEVSSQDAIDALSAVIEEAKGFDTKGQINKEGLDTITKALRQARLDFLAALNLPSSDAWYYISSLDETRSDDLLTNGGMMYVNAYGEGQDILWALNDDESYSYNPFAMWHFIPVEDDTYPLTYYVQNLATGLYMGDYATYSVQVPTSKEPVLYQLNYSGGQLGFVARKGQNPGYSLHAANSGNRIVGWSAGAKTASAWAITEVDRTSIDAITIPATTNTIDVFAVPYEFSDLADYNEDVKTYGVKKITKNEDGSADIELYEKTSFAAGEPCVLVTGDPTIEDREETSLVVSMPTTIATEMTPANGLVGLLTTEPIPLKAAWFDGKQAVAKDETVNISAHTGYIDATLYEGEVEGVETAMTLTVPMLNWPETELVWTKQATYGPVPASWGDGYADIFTCDGVKAGMKVTVEKYSDNSFVIRNWLNTTNADYDGYSDIEITYDENGNVTTIGGNAESESPNYFYSGYPGTLDYAYFYTSGTTYCYVDPTDEAGYIYLYYCAYNNQAWGNWASYYLSWTDEETKAGDVNEDGATNGADVVAIYNYIQSGEASNVKATNADVNKDQSVNGADVVEVYNIIVGGAAGAPAYVLPETVVGDVQNVDSEGKADISVLVGSTEDLTQIPVTVFLTNPENKITQLDVALKAPVAPAKFAYDEEEENYIYDKGARWNSTHSPFFGAGTKEFGEDRFYISITSSTTKNFKQTEGAIITVYFDGSELADGDYVVNTSNAIATESDLSSSTIYHSTVADAAFSIKGGKATAIASITAEQIAAAKAIYTLDGVKVAAPVKGNIYIVDGKKVKY